MGIGAKKKEDNEKEEDDGKREMTSQPPLFPHRNYVAHHSILLSGFAMIEQADLLKPNGLHRHFVARYCIGE